MRVVNGVVQHYAWGDREAIPRLLGQTPDGRPWAEAWYGTHAGGPASLDDGAPLSSLTGELPYLLKLLAAEAPLSLQTHPDGETAAAGFEREQRAGLAVDAPTRIYRDRSAKPELVCALTPFEALCGFRPVVDTLEVLDRVGADALRAVVAGGGVAAAFTALYREPALAADTVAAVSGCNEPEAGVARDLARRHPGDPSAAVSLLLNHVVLEPGEALFLDAGNLHAYLRGVGVEVMGASDNVVRGGLTSKHVDVDELLRVVKPMPLTNPVVAAVEESPGCFRYPTPAAPFTLWRLEIGATPLRVTATGPELLLCTSGDAATIRAGTAVALVAGDSVELHGSAMVFRVAAVGGYRQSR